MHPGQDLRMRPRKVGLMLQDLGLQRPKNHA